MYFVYKLIDPRTNQIRYIGITQDLESRFYQHTHVKTSNDAKVAWIQDLKDHKLTPIIEVIEQNKSRVVIEERERYWIRCYLAQGMDLLNMMMNFDPVNEPCEKKRLICFGLRALRKKNNMTLKQFAALAGLSEGTVMRLEKGIPTTSFATIHKVTAVFGVTTKDIFRPEYE